MESIHHEFKKEIGEFESLVNSNNHNNIKSKMKTVVDLGEKLINEYSRKGDPKDKKLITATYDLIKETSKIIKGSSISKSVSIFKRSVEEKASLKQNQELVHSLNSSLTSIENKINDLTTHGMAIEHFKSSFPKKLGYIRDKFINGMFGFLLKRVNKRIFLGAGSKATLKKLEKKLAGLSEYESLGSQADVLNSKIAQIKDNHKKAKETREGLHQIGATRVKINLPNENVVLDGMHISAHSFRKSLQEAGAKNYELSFTKNDNTTVTFKGIAFPKGTEEGKVQKALETLGAFGSNDEPGAGWKKITDQDGHILLVTDEEFEQLQHMGAIEDGKILDNFSGKDIILNNVKMVDLNTDPKETVSTVLITSGNYGVYEMHKREILAFLIRGMDVMTFNFRGYGESTGKPTGEGVKRDMEAAYKYLKDVHKIDDKKLLIKGLCMSGGPAASLAANHPETNLFIDQSYAEFSDVMLENVNKYIGNFVKQNKLQKSTAGALKAWAAKKISPIITSILKLASPAWSIKKEIGNVTGHIGILQTKQDNLMKFDRTANENFKSAFEGSPSTSTHLYAIDGDHAALWVNPHSPAFLVKEVKKEDVQKLSEQKGTIKTGEAEYFGGDLMGNISSFEKKGGSDVELVKEETSQLLIQERLNSNLTKFDETGLSANDKLNYALELKSSEYKPKIKQSIQDMGAKILKEYTNALQKNYLEVGDEALELFVENHQDIPNELKPLMKELLKASQQKENPLSGFYKKLTEHINENRLSIDELKMWIEDNLKEYPASLKMPFNKFLENKIFSSLNNTSNLRDIAKQFVGFKDGAFKKVNSRKELGELLNEFLKEKKISPKCQHIIKNILQKTFIFRDPAQVFKYKFSSPDEFKQLLDGKLNEMDNAIDKQLIKNHGNNLYNAYTKALGNGDQDLTSFLDGYFYSQSLSEDLRPLIEEVLKGCTKEEHPFVGFYEKLMDVIEKEKLPPPQIDKWIDKNLEKFSDPLKIQFKQFINEITKDIAAKPEVINKRYEGRRIMDNFLRKADLT